MLAGLSLGTIMTSRFLTNTSGFPATKPSFTALLTSSWAAEAKTSARAPCWIWVSSVELDSKLWRTSTPGCCSSKVVASSPKASVSEEAAKTVSVALRSPPPAPAAPPPQPLNERASASTNSVTNEDIPLEASILAPPDSNHEAPMVVGGRSGVFVHVAQRLGKVAEALYSSKCVEVVFSEVQIYEVLRSSYSPSRDRSRVPLSRPG